MSDVNDNVNHEYDVNEIEEEIENLSDQINKLSNENYILTMTIKKNIDNDPININLSTSEFVSKLIELEHKNKDDSFQMGEYVKDNKNKILLNSYSSIFSSLNSIFNISQSHFVSLRKKIQSFCKNSTKFNKNESLTEKIKKNSTVKIYLIKENDYIQQISSNKSIATMTLDEIATFLTEKQDSYFCSAILKHDHLYNVIDQYSLYKIKKKACNYFKIKDTDFLMINLCGELTNLDGILHDEIKKINIERKLIDSTDKFYMMSDEIISLEKFKFTLISKELYCQIIGVRYNLISIYNPAIKSEINKRQLQNLAKLKSSILIKSKNSADTNDSNKEENGVESALSLDRGNSFIHDIISPILNFIIFSNSDIYRINSETFKKFKNASDIKDLNFENYKNNVENNDLNKGNANNNGNKLKEIKKVKFKKKEVDNTENMSLKSKQSINTINSKNEAINNKLIINNEGEKTSKMKLFKLIFDNIIKKNMIIYYQNKDIILNDLNQKYPIYFRSICMNNLEVYEIIENIVIHFDIQSIMNTSINFGKLNDDLESKLSLFEKYNETDKNDKYAISDKMLKSIYSCSYDKVNEVMIKYHSLKLKKSIDFEIKEDIREFINDFNSYSEDFYEEESEENFDKISHLNESEAIKDDKNVEKNENMNEIPNFIRFIMIISVMIFLLLFFFETYSTSKNLSKNEFLGMIDNIFKSPVDCLKKFSELKDVREINYWTSICLLDPLINFLSNQKTNSLQFDNFIVELNDYHIVNCNITDFSLYQNEYNYPYCISENPINSFLKRINIFDTFGITNDIIENEFYNSDMNMNLFADNLRLSDAFILRFDEKESLSNLNDLIQFSAKIYDDLSPGISNFIFGFKTKIQNKMIDFYKQIRKKYSSQTNSNMNNAEIHFNPINKENINLILPSTKNFQYRLFFSSKDNRLFGCYNILGNSDEAGFMNVKIIKRAVTNIYLKEDFESKDRWIEKNQLQENILAMNIIKWSRVVLFFIIGMELSYIHYSYKCPSIKALKIIFVIAILISIINLFYGLSVEFSTGVDYISESNNRMSIGSVFDTFYYYEFNIKIFNIITIIVMTYFLILITFKIENIAIFKIMIQPIIQRFFFIIIIASLAISMFVKELFGKYESFHSSLSGAFIYVFLSILGLDIDISTSSKILYSESIKTYHEIMDFIIYLTYLITLAFFFGILLYEMMKMSKQSKVKSK